MNCRLLSLNDYHKGYFELLSQLTISPKISYNEFVTIFQEIFINRNHEVFVIEDVELQKIIGSGTVIIENKFIRAGRSIGHIEDIVVDASYRKQKLGQLIVNQLIDFCKLRNCYKIILDCTPNNASFYEKLGFHKSESENMVVYFN